MSVLPEVMSVPEQRQLNTVAQALQVSREARVITVGTSPCQIVHTNKGAQRPELMHLYVV